MPTAFDIANASYTGTSFDVSSEDTAPRDFRWDSSGDKLFLLGDQNNNIYEYSS